jgi:anaerobic magnesium-protoporphyrin IX monomethyl ester cyclase
MKPIPRDQLRILLVQPSTHRAVQSLFTFHKNEGLGHKPPLAILTLATHLREQGFTDTSCLDAQLDDLSPEETVDRITAQRPDVVGVTVWTDFWYPAWRTIELIRGQLPDCTIVVGGPHCLVYPGETLTASAADYAVNGDGEDVLLSIVQAVSEGGTPPPQPGLWTRCDGEIVPPPEPFAVVKDLDRIPIPDRTLLPFTRYASVLNPRAYETTMITSRGCPHRCVFCKMHVQKVNAQSADRVVEEFAQIAALGIEDVQVYDDTFTWSKRRLHDICTGICERGLKIRWAIRDRVDKASPQNYDLLRQAGCHRIHFGIESGSPAVLEASGKAITLEQARSAIEMAQAAGFTTLAYYMFGFLDETLDDARLTIRVAREMPTDYAVFAVLIPYPGTHLYEEALRRGVIRHDFWADFVHRPTPDFCIPELIEQHLDRQTLIGLKDEAMRAFYLRPSRLLSELRRLRSWGELRRKSAMACNIIRDALRSGRRVRADHPQPSSSPKGLALYRDGITVPRHGTEEPGKPTTRNRERVISLPVIEAERTVPEEVTP